MVKVLRIWWQPKPFLFRLVLEHAERIDSLRIIFKLHFLFIDLKKKKT